MEKKSNNRSSQLQTKSQSIDSKKQQDVSGKLWPRSSKKRESPSSSSARSDVNRKPAPQRGKAFDKRPKPRGAYHGSAVGGKSESGLDEDGAEVGSVFLPGSKKQSLNHLLNFQYAPRDAGQQQGGRKPHGLVYTNKHKHSKELFLQSNCQFVVKADGDYTPHLVDPDIPVNWDSIEQINVRVNEPLSCPICLGEVVAAHITRCGHTYCWPCLLHYFALSEDSYRPCPICFQPIDKKHLKSVQGVWQDSFPVGSEIRMKLMRRIRGNTDVEPAPPLVLDRKLSPKSNSQFLSMSEKNHSTLFSKLLTASPQEVMEIINRERTELSQHLVAESVNPEFCFIQEALNLLQQRESTLVVLHETILPVLEAVPIRKQEVVLSPSDGSGGLSFVNDWEFFNRQSESDDGSNVEENESNLNADAPIFTLNLNSDIDEIENAIVTPIKTAVSTADAHINTENQSKYYYFYQAADGQAIFLDGLDVRILETSWGSLSNAPRELKGRILQRASGSVGVDSRRRLRCLQHLPIHCPYDLVEIQLESPYVSDEALKSFRGELEERKRQRQRRARDEKRRERVISQQEQRLMGHMPGLRVNINSDEHFPAYQPDLDASPSANDWHWEPEGESPRNEASGGLSFAKMASGTGNWGNRYNHNPAAPVASVPRNRRDTDGSESDSAVGAPPSYNVSLSEAISAALLNTSLDPQSDVSTAASGKKKKKQKPKVLFTTGIQHRTISN